MTADEFFLEPNIGKPGAKVGYFANYAVNGEFPDRIAARFAEFTAGQANDRGTDPRR
ncbi:hypothetical protein [Nocardia sp. NPDC052112]|uniref:hypothetical protein n=1 Tax=Nocardia sp. NPDC052112 TaxID=3155646 RepID=UPI003426D9ED